MKANNLSSTIQDRLNAIFLEYRLTQKSFSEKTGIIASSVSGMVGKRKSSPSFDAVQKINIAFPEIDMNWFISGEGDMLRTEPSDQPESETESEIKDKYISAMEKLTKVQEENKELLNEILQLKTAQ